MKVIFFGVFSILPIIIYGQVVWPSPEIGQMYNNANNYIERGNYKDAVTTCKQAILLAPDLPVFTNQLATVYYLSGNFNEAENTLNKLKPSDCDTQCYRLLAASQVAQTKFKQSEKTINTGIDRFPHSGPLYHQKGIIYKLELNEEDALDSWLDGMEKDPGFAPDYYDAALSSFNSGQVLWGLIYSEIFLAMNHDTIADSSIKGKMFEGYKTLFENIAESSSSKTSKTVKKQLQPEFEVAVLKAYSMLTPVVSDGISAENLVMLRTRFIMNWFDEHPDKYPFPLFNYMNDLITTGHFEIYNEWLFGAAENREQYDAWNKFHEGDIDRFKVWKAANPLVPASFTYRK